MWKLATYLKPYWKSAVLAPLLMLLEVAMDLLQPKLMASIVNDGVMKGDLAHIRNTGALMLLYALIGLIGGVGCTIFSSIASQYFGADLRRDLFRHVQTFSFRNLDRFKAGTLVTRLTSDVVQMQNMVQTTLRILVRSPFLALGSIVMAFLISAKLALILVVVIPLLFLSLYMLIRWSFPLFAQVQQKLDTVNNVLQENLSGIRVVKAFVRAGYERSRFGKANGEYTGIALQAARTLALNMPLMMLLMNASIVAVLWFGGAQTWSGGMQVGDLAAFLNYVTQVLASLMSVGMMLMTVSRAKASAERINEVFATRPDISDPPQPGNHEIRRGEIVFDRVSFGYGKGRRKLALQDVSFTAKAGQTVAILGATGSGKSSLVHLIPRLYDVSEGQIRIDGVDIREMMLDRLRTRVGMVLQQAVLFSGTIRDNLRFGRPDATQEQVEEAAKAAQAHDFIMSFPDGYDTPLGQRGVNLSGGQKQRISIARALLVRPAVLILDDSTSAVDLGTESRIQKALKELMAGRTCLIIAQRISSVLDADNIIVLDGGRIAAEGTHQELMSRSALYRDIYKSQLGEEEIVYGG